MCACVHALICVGVCVCGGGGGGERSVCARACVYVEVCVGGLPSKNLEGVCTCSD